MGIVSSRFITATTLVAALSMAATPAMAAPLAAPVGTAVGASAQQLPGIQGWQVEGETVNRHRRGDRRWGGYGRSHHRHRRHRGGISAGNVIAGVLIIGGIAAIASAASKSNRDKRARDDDYRTREYPYRGGSSGYRGGSDNTRNNGSYSGRSGINDAVNSCVREVERNGQVDEVESAGRAGDGWRVTGSLRSGCNFSCEVGNDGRVRNVDTDRSNVSGERPNASADRQWDDERYARARDAQQQSSGFPGGV